jgi:hypothetical protein
MPRKSIKDLEGMKLSTENIWEKYTFSEEEKKILSMRLANVNQDKMRLDEEKKSMASSFKAKIDTSIAEINKLSMNISNGYEHRNFKCYKLLNFTTSMREYYSAETGELIQETPFMPEDYQHKLNV